MLSRRELLVPGAGAAFFAANGSLGFGASKRFRPLEQILARSQTTSMLILEDGAPVFTYGDVKEISYVASVRKSLVSMLYGLWVERGSIHPDATLGEIGFTDSGGLLPVEQQATIRNLLTARSGVYHPAANAGDASSRAPARGSVRPGSYFLYNNWDFNALEAVFEKLTERKLYSAFYEGIGKPAGFEDWNEDLQAIRNDTGASLHPAHHFVLSTRDMARLGQLMLGKGRYQGNTIVPESWVRLTTSLITPAAEVARTSPFVPGLGYGYLWWIFDPAGSWSPDLRQAYTASGAFGQFITVIPRRRMVIAHKTAVPPQRNVAAADYLQQILPAALARR